MQSRLAASQSASLPKGPEAVSRTTARSDPPRFVGTIASVCELGLGIDNFIEMARFARASDPKVARFLKAWDGLGDSEQQSEGSADAVCEQIGLAPVELLKVVAEATCRISMYSAQIIAALSHPSVVEKTIERALTDEGIADRVALHKAMGFLPMPAGSQTNIAVVQSARSNATARPLIVAPRPEETTHRLSDRLSEARAKVHGSENSHGK